MSLLKTNMRYFRRERIGREDLSHQIGDMVEEENTAYLQPEDEYQEDWDRLYGTPDDYHFDYEKDLNLYGEPDDLDFESLVTTRDFGYYDW
jgi:hypothetical protein